MRAATLVSLLILLVTSGCGPPPARQRDPWDEEMDRAGRGGGDSGEALNVRVDVQVYEIEQRDSEGWSLFWAASVPVGPARLRVNGLRAATGGPEFFARLDAWERRSTVRRKTSPFIVVADGYPGEIQVGEAIVEPVTIFYMEEGQVIDTWQWSRTGCVLSVTPKRLGNDLVSVTVRPEVSHREGDGRTRFARLETAVTVKEGEAVIIGGSEESEGSVGSTFFSRSESNRRYRVVFVLTARGW